MTNLKMCIRDSCFVAPDNVPSLSLQAKLGLTNIHIPAIWLF